tara:strand:+ start:103 stop:447 length:345 start_codon:yes stop_codon:yes gene_type:complete
LNFIQELCLKTTPFRTSISSCKISSQRRVATYGAIGKFLGSAKSARMVSWAMNSSHNQSPKVPAHRVVNRNGLLTEKHHFSDENTMINLLEDEGIEVTNNQVFYFKNHFWYPSE